MSESIDRGVPAPPARRTNLIKAFREEPQSAPELAPTLDAASSSTAPAPWPPFADADSRPVIAQPAGAPAAVSAPPSEAPMTVETPRTPDATVFVPAAAPATTAPPRTAPIAQRRITFDLPEDLRLRVRTVFKKTRNDEDDESFGDMMRKMTEAECRRREALYNGGQRYPTDARPLQAGRSII